MVGKASTRAKNKYNKNNYDQFLVTVPAGKKAALNELSKKFGYKSRNEFIIHAIESTYGINLKDETID